MLKITNENILNLKCYFCKTLVKDFHNLNYKKVCNCLHGYSYIGTSAVIIQISEIKNISIRKETALLYNIADLNIKLEHIFKNLNLNNFSINKINNYLNLL